MQPSTRAGRVRRVSDLRCAEGLACYLVIADGVQGCEVAEAKHQEARRKRRAAEELEDDVTRDPRARRRSSARLTEEGAKLEVLKAAERRRVERRRRDDHVLDVRKREVREEPELLSDPEQRVGALRRALKAAERPSTPGR